MKFKLFAAVVLAVAMSGAWAATPAGKIGMLVGQGTATDAGGVVRALKRGDTFYSGEILSSGANSYVNLEFSDGGLILLRPNSRFQIEEYAFAAETKTAEPVAAPAPVVAETAVAPSAPAVAPAFSAQAASSSSKSYFKLLRGGFRAVSGLIGKGNADQYRVRTPVATIGIRGTDWVLVLCDVACAADPVVAGSMGPGRSAAGGSMVGVIKGGVFVAANSNGQTTEVPQDQYLVTLPDGSIVKLPFEPRFLRIDPIPDPKACKKS